MYITSQEEVIHNDDNDEDVAMARQYVEQKMAEIKSISNNNSRSNSKV